MAINDHQRVTKGRQGPSWQAQLRNFIGLADTCIGDESDFRGEVKYSRLGDVYLVNVLSSREISRRTAQHVRRDPQDQYILANVKSGAIQLRQQKSHCELTAGSFALFRTDRPFEWEHHDPASVSNVAIPGNMLRARLRNIDSFLLRPQSGQSGVWRVLHDLLESLGQQSSVLPETATYTFATQLVELLGVSLESGEYDEVPLGVEALRKAMYRRCVAFIRSNLSDDNLNPDKIALAVGLSVRSLHRLFREAGEPVGTFLRISRLEKSCADLADPGKTHFSIGEIACQAGFRSQAHFANIFKSRYQMAANEWRRNAQIRQHRMAANQNSISPH
jgi:AraC-like DNA-binding protein